ncbi:uncharacterized protein CLUP02_08791 [Colletotrichum lupini]|uniref:Uncharacterized protein n=1 Tax=Colletotrichum lupini TaxID=145971 RepID=A0A9Q8SVD1_9PEZI|nr:uncharacterized protein CLUP02_08791 [Colletotrichum lupini]UQC83297.1 hypothetical protein CLUP02_08791 [Colletotrichum lupini]
MRLTTDGITQEVKLTFSRTTHTLVMLKCSSLGCKAEKIVKTFRDCDGQKNIIVGQYPFLANLSGYPGHPAARWDKVSCGPEVTTSSSLPPSSVRPGSTDQLETVLRGEVTSSFNKKKTTGGELFPPHATPSLLFRLIVTLPSRRRLCNCTVTRKESPTTELALIPGNEGGGGGKRQHRDDREIRADVKRPDYTQTDQVSDEIEFLLFISITEIDLVTYLQTPPGRVFHPMATHSLHHALPRDEMFPLLDD